MNELQGIMIERAGAYLHIEDAVLYLREIAEQYDQAGNPSASLALRAVADAWSGEEPAPNQEEAAPVISLVTADPGADVYLVEVFPDNPEEPRPRWHARTVDNQGRILTTTNGSFDQNYVVKDAKDRWPGVEVLLVPDQNYDSVWEQQTGADGQHIIRSASSGRRRQSPNRMFS